MRLTHLTLKNWRNFKHADFDLQDQVLLTTHSEEVLQDPGLGKDEVVVLRPGDEGARQVTIVYFAVEGETKFVDRGVWS